MSPTNKNKNSVLWLAIMLFCMAVSVHQAKETNQNHGDENNNNLLRKSIVFDLKTPKVFYCPQEKPSVADKMIVKAQPLDKLCEFDGQRKPKGAKSDCYNDVDESEFACDEKKRFMIRLDLAGEVDTADLRIDDLEYILAKGTTKKKSSPGGKKY